MSIKVNGETLALSAPQLSVADVLTQNGVENLGTVSVQLNGEFLDQAAYRTTRVKAGDEVDFLFFLGGGGL